VFAHLDECCSIRALSTFFPGVRVITNVVEVLQAPVLKVYVIGRLGTHNEVSG
jgi:hypothetical protein